MSKSLDDLNAAFHHAESIGQSRLSNYLTTGSILLVTCIVALRIDSGIIGGLACIGLSCLGIYLSTIWCILGTRQQKYHEMIEQRIVEVVRNYSPSHEEKFECARAISNFKELKEHKYRNKRDDITELEDQFSSRRLLTRVPRLFSKIYLMLLILGAAHLYIAMSTEGSRNFYVLILIVSIVLIFNVKLIEFVELVVTAKKERIYNNSVTTPLASKVENAFGKLEELIKKSVGWNR